MSLFDMAYHLHSTLRRWTPRPQEALHCRRTISDLMFVLNCLTVAQ